MKRYEILKNIIDIKGKELFFIKSTFYKTYENCYVINFKIRTKYNKEEIDIFFKSFLKNYKDIFVEKDYEDNSFFIKIVIDYNNEIYNVIKNIHDTTKNYYNNEDINYYLMAIFGFDGI